MTFTEMLDAEIEAAERELGDFMRIYRADRFDLFAAILENCTGLPVR